MFVRCTHLSFLPEKIKEATQVYTAEVAPVIQNQKGNKQTLWMEPEQEGEDFISMSLWEKEADMKAFEAGTEYPTVMGKIKAFTSKPPVQKYYSVND